MQCNLSNQSCSNQNSVIRTEGAYVEGGAQVKEVGMGMEAGVREAEGLLQTLRAVEILKLEWATVR